MGIKDRRLISSPNQAPYQEVADVEIIVPIINVIENINVLGLVGIRKRRIELNNNLHMRGMNPLA